MDLQSFRQDLAGERDGVWLNVGGDLEVKLRSTRSKQYASAARKFMADRAMELGIGDDEQMSEEDLGVCGAKAIASELLVDWRGMTEGGEPVSYSDELAQRYAEDPSLYRFWNRLASLANNLDNYSARKVEARVGKSEGSTSGTSTTETTSSDSEQTPTPESPQEPGSST